MQNNLWADCDLTMMRSVLVNLLDNAKKFTVQVTSPRIEVGSYLESNERIYYVSDNGVGFDMKYIADVFTPFRRLHQGTQYQGSGVGLASVQRIINRHGGRVWAHSNVGAGTTVYFSLPVTLKTNTNNDSADSSHIGNVHTFIAEK